MAVRKDYGGRDALLHLTARGRGIIWAVPCRATVKNDGKRSELLCRPRARARVSESRKRECTRARRAIVYADANHHFDAPSGDVTLYIQSPGPVSLK